MTPEVGTEAATQTAKKLSAVEEAVQKLGTLPENQVEPEKAPERQASTVQQQDYDMEGNLFFAYVTDPDKTVSKAARRDAIAELLTYNEQQSPAENKKRLSQYEYFKEYMMSQLKNRSEDIIKTTDQKNMVELHDMFNEIHQAVLSYGDSMGVPKAILNAITKVRESGDPRMILNIFQCFAQEDKERAEHKLKVDNLEAQLKANEDQSKRWELEIARLEQDTYIWGAMKGQAKQQRAQLRIKKADLDAIINGRPAANGKPAIAGQIETLQYLKDHPPEEKYPQYHDEKIQLRKLKDLSGEEWEAKAQQLIEDALNFTTTTDQRGRAVLASQLDKRNHVDILDQLTDQLKGVYSLLDDAESAATDANKAIFDRLEKAEPNEDQIDMDERDKKLKAASLYISEAEQSKSDTEQVRDQLVQQSLVLSTFRSRLSDKIRDARNLVGSVNAEVASSLALTIEAVGAAATDAAGLMAEDATRVIQDDNADTLEGEMKRNGSSAEEQAARILANVEKMKRFDEMVETITEKTLKGLDDKNAANDEAVKAREHMQDNLKKLDTATASRVTSTFNESSKDAASATNDNAADNDAAPAAAPRMSSRKAPDLTSKLGAFD